MCTRTALNINFIFCLIWIVIWLWTNLFFLFISTNIIFQMSNYPNKKNIQNVRAFDVVHKNTIKLHWYFTILLIKFGNYNIFAFRRMITNFQISYHFEGFYSFFICHTKHIDISKINSNRNFESLNVFVSLKAKNSNFQVYRQKTKTSMNPKRVCCHCFRIQWKFSS